MWQHLLDHFRGTRLPLYQGPAALASSLCPLLWDVGYPATHTQFVGSGTQEPYAAIPNTARLENIQYIHLGSS